MQFHDVMMTKKFPLAPSSGEVEYENQINLHVFSPDISHIYSQCSYYNMQPGHVLQSIQASRFSKAALSVAILAISFVAMTATQTNTNSSGRVLPSIFSTYTPPSQDEHSKLLLLLSTTITDQPIYTYSSLCSARCRDKHSAL